MPQASLNQHRKNAKTPQNALPSSSIDRTKLVPTEVVIDKNQSMICESKVSALALKLARESFFGEDVVVRCTVGDHELPALPQHELDLLKGQIIFPAY